MKIYQRKTSSVELHDIFSERNRTILEKISNGIRSTNMIICYSCKYRRQNTEEDHMFIATKMGQTPSYQQYKLVLTQASYHAIGK